MNVITVTLKDRTKTASCRETVALCAKYALTVSPALEVDEGKTETIDGVKTRIESSRKPKPRSCAYFMSGTSAAGFGFDEPAWSSMQRIVVFGSRRRCIS